MGKAGRGRSLQNPDPQNPGAYWGPRGPQGGAALGLALGFPRGPTVSEKRRNFVPFLLLTSLPSEGIPGIMLRILTH